MTFVESVSAPSQTPWLLHLESLTLARVAYPDKGGACLLGQSFVPPCESAYLDFVAALASFSGWKTSHPDDIVMLNYEAMRWEMPPVLVFTPPDKPGFLVMSNGLPRFAFGYMDDIGVIGPIWDMKEKSDRRERRIRSAWKLGNAVGDLGLDETFADCWLKEPDRLALEE